MAATDKPMLRLSTVIDRTPVEITIKDRNDKLIVKTYELANQQDFGPYEYAVIVMRHGEMNELLRKKKRTKAQNLLLSQILDQLVQMIVLDTVSPRKKTDDPLEILHIDAATLAKLTHAQKSTLIVAWASELMNGSAPPPKATRRPSRPTGAGSSRGSKNSTAATRRGGSTSRRGSSPRT
jgi:hypothetical protein